MHLQHVRASRKFVFMLVLGLGVTATAVHAEDTTASIMRDVYDAIAYLLPLSLRADTDTSAWDQELIEKKLVTLKAASAALKAHTAGDAGELRYLAGSFDEMTADVTKAFANEWPEFAYFSVMDLVQHCVACHSRVEAPSQALFGQRLISRMDTREIPPSDVIKLYVATRQFDAATRTIEKMLMAPDRHPIEADYSSLMVDYLQITIAAKREPAMAQQFLRRYLSRPDMPYYLKRRFEFWIETLQQLTPAIAAPPDFARAIEIFHAGDDVSPGPGNRMGAVHDVTAASILRRYLDAGGERNAETLHEAYFVLGVIALRTLEPKSAVPEMEMLLATSIKAAPEGKHALEAYALIEEYGYVHEEHLAAQDTSQTLLDMDELRKLLAPRL
ncbi:MAG: hypothetical protein ACU85U_21805 [Gammaproteobacteria bacterium]|jgi:hypothetical protein